MLLSLNVAQDQKTPVGQRERFEGTVLSEKSPHQGSREVGCI